MFTSISDKNARSNFRTPYKHSTFHWNTGKDLMCHMPEDSALQKRHSLQLVLFTMKSSWVISHGVKCSMLHTFCLSSEDDHLWWWREKQPLKIQTPVMADHPRRPILYWNCQGFISYFIFLMYCYVVFSTRLIRKSNFILQIPFLKCYSG
jgi:hypothetical protein